MFEHTFGEEITGIRLLSNMQTCFNVLIFLQGEEPAPSKWQDAHMQIRDTFYSVCQATNRWCGGCGVEKNPMWLVMAQTWLTMQKQLPWGVT